MIPDNPIAVLLTIENGLFQGRDVCYTVKCKCGDEKITGSEHLAVGFAIYHLQDHLTGGLKWTRTPFTKT